MAAFSLLIGPPGRTLLAMTTPRGTTRLALTAAAAATGILLAGCSGSSTGGEVTAVTVAEQLEAFDCTNLESTRQEDDEGNTYSVVSCELGTSGGIAVNVADTTEDFDGIKAFACSDVVGNEEAAGLQVAYGANWLGIAISTTGIGVQDLADSLGGTVGTIQDFCS